VFAGPFEVEEEFEAAIYGWLLDTCPSSRDAIDRRRIELNQAFRRGATVVVFYGPEIGNGRGTPLGGWLESKFGITINPAAPPA